MQKPIMAFKNLSFLIMFVVFSFLASLSNADDYKSAPKVSPETICESTQDPSYCKALLSNYQYGNIYDYGRICVQMSLNQSRKFMDLVDSHLQGGYPLSKPTIGALEDCRSLAELNLDYLSNTQGKVDKADEALPPSQAEDGVTLLSAILTNQQTCLEGLQITSSDERVKSGLYSSLSNDTKLHSVSLALFTKGWVPDQKRMEKSWQHNHGRGRHGGRKLLQAVSSGSVNVKDTVVVSKDGTGDFTTINDAIAAAPNNSASSAGYFVVFIKKGVYQEYVSIAKNKKYLMLLGDGINQTIITGDHNVVDGSTTFNSATFAVVAQGFVAVNITFRNTAGPSKHQAVALRSGADLSAFYSCSFEGYQDTLYIHSLRQFYRDCDIYGTVDFIFGNAAAVFQNCNILPRLPASGQFNAITAQGRTDPNQNTGISIQNARIRAADDLGTVKTYLGRPWKEYSRTVVMQSFVDSLVDPAGWHEWSGTFALSTLYYAEYSNTGPGSSTANRVTWPGYHVIGAVDAGNFTVGSFLQGNSWLPPTGVPFLTGLN